MSAYIKNALQNIIWVKLKWVPFSIPSLTCHRALLTCCFHFIKEKKNWAQKEGKKQIDGPYV